MDDACLVTGFITTTSQARGDHKLHIHHQPQNPAPTRRTRRTSLYGLFLFQEVSDFDAIAVGVVEKDLLDRGARNMVLSDHNAMLSCFSF